mgnify:CR=1 FL=1
MHRVARLFPSARGVRGAWEQQSTRIKKARTLYTRGSRAHEQTNQRNTRHTHATRVRPALHHPITPFQPPAGCRRAQITQHSHLTTSSRTWRAHGPGATRRPSECYLGRLQTPTTQLMRHTSAQGPYRLRRAPQPAVDPLLGRPVLDLRRESAGEIRHPTADCKHGLGQMDGRFQWEHSSDHYPYLIGTVKNLSLIHI